MLIVVFFINLILYLSVSVWANAIYDPLSVKNNKLGIHILFPSELDQAQKIVNNNSGSWGYVTIPIQATDRDRIKWQKFFDECANKKIIPLVRVATFPDGSNWMEPNNFDLIDFANFLGDLRWPTQNRYVIIFNEVNRSDEYGGYVSPENYADILANASDIFKAKNQDFFILPAGLDNAAINTRISMAPRRYIERMYLHRLDIFDKIDGWTSHAYPNPAFNSRPDKSGINKIDSYKYDLKLIRQFTLKKLPIFITETGWSNENLSDRQVSLYYKYAMEKVWNDPDIVSINPFLLNAQDGPFTKFSFIDKDGQPKEFVETFSSYSSVGEPVLENSTSNDLLITPSSTPEASPQKFIGKSYSVFKTFLDNIVSIFGLFPNK